jgi:hypothetical protein
MAAFVPSLELRIDVQGSAAQLARSLRHLDDYEAAALDGFADGQLETAWAVYDLSQVYVPVDTGLLKASATVTEFGTQAVLGRKRPAGGRYAPKRDTFGVMVTYGGGVETSQYAEIVHEDLEAHHAPPTSAKYLERAVHELEAEMATLWGEGIVRATRAAQL